MTGLQLGFAPLKAWNTPEAKSAGEAMGKAGYDTMRPTMQQSDHPVHNMPKSEHDGDNLPVNSPAVSESDEQ